MGHLRTRVSSGPGFPSQSADDGSSESQQSRFCFRRRCRSALSPGTETPAASELDPFDGILVPTDVEEVISFGQRVAISGDTAVVGAPGFTGFGAVYVFMREPGVGRGWQQVAKLTGLGGRLQFPTSLAISGDTIVVGVTDVLQQLSDGVALVFQRNAGGPKAWGHVATLSVQGERARGSGKTSRIDGDTILVGAFLIRSARSAAIGVPI